MNTEHAIGAATSPAEQQPTNETTPTNHIRNVMGEVFKSYHNALQTFKVDPSPTEDKPPLPIGTLIGKGFTIETIRESQFGYAPNDQSDLIKAHKDSDLLATGLFYRGDDGEITPIHKHRLVIPFFSYYFDTARVPVYSVGVRWDIPFGGPEQDGDEYVEQRTHNERTPDVHPNAVRKHVWQHEHIHTGDRVLVVPTILDAIQLQQNLPEECVISEGTKSWQGNGWDKTHIECLAQGTKDVGQAILVTATADNSKDEDQARAVGAELDKTLKSLHDTPDTADTLIPDKKEVTGKEGNTGNTTSNGEVHTESVAQNLDKLKKGEYIPKVRILRLRHLLPLNGSPVTAQQYLDEGKRGELLEWIQRSQTLAYNNARVHKITKPQRFFDKKTFQPQLPLNEVYLENNYFMNTGEQLYVYKGGVYEPTGRDFIDKEVGPALGDKANAYYLNTVADLAEKQNKVDEALVNNYPGEINLQNGWFNLVTGAVTPHTPERKSTVQLPHDSTKQTTEAKDEFLAFINKVIPPDAVTLVQMVCGYCLHHDASFQRAFLLYGKGGNGKGTLLKLIMAMLGKGNYATQSLKKLSDTRWGTAELFGKMANIVEDINSAMIRDSSDFKMLAAGETISAERKNKDPFDFENKAKLIFSANKIPTSLDKTHGFYRRWVFIDMGKVIPPEEEKLNYINTLKTPAGLSAFFHWAVEGLQALLEAKQFPKPKSSDNLLSKYKKENDHVLNFVKEHLIYEEGANRLLVSGLRDTYKQWCEEWGHKPTPNKLKEAIEAEFGEQGVRQQRDRVEGKQARFWINLHYNPAGIPDTDGFEVDEDDNDEVEFGD